MAGSNKNNPAEDLMASLLKEVGGDIGGGHGHPEPHQDHAESIEKLDLQLSPAKPIVKKESGNLIDSADFNSQTESDYEKSQSHHHLKLPAEHPAEEPHALNLSVPSPKPSEVGSASESLFGPSASASPTLAPAPEVQVKVVAPVESARTNSNDETVALNQKPVAKNLSSEHSKSVKKEIKSDYSEHERTIAVTAFQHREVESHEDKVKVSIGQQRSAYSPGYAAWGGGTEASLGQAENLRMAQEKILDLQKENEKLREQNEDLMSASDIIKERSDLLTAQVNEYRNDKENLEESFKNETALLKGHLNRKDVEFQKAQIKIDDLDSRLKFDMKKIRIRERELENRLELIRAEKNALTKSKDEQILDLRRKMDVLQMEVDSYRQKCIDLNRSLETNQDSFKRTTRALRLAMANLELQEENKVSLKKVD